MPLWGLIATSSGSYPTAHQFWKVHLPILGSAYLLSATGFLLLRIDPLLLLLGLVCVSFIIQSNPGTSDQPDARESWWACKLHQRQREGKEEQEP